VVGIRYTLQFTYEKEVFSAKKVKREGSYEEKERNSVEFTFHMLV